jgi:SAM-dependent methyltransferase
MPLTEKTSAPEATPPSPLKDKREFHKVQSLYFEEAEEKKYRHQTRHPYFAETERGLLEGVRVGPNVRLLEVGCGEGGNLFLLNSSRAQLFGVDLFPRKLVFAQRELPNCKFVCGGAEQLPFGDATFDVVFCRDVLHHLFDPEPALKEMARVCRPGGQMVIIEPNGKNPLLCLQAWLIKAERETRRNSPESVERLLRRVVGVEPKLKVLQPFPLFRMVLHYRFGIPRLGHWKFVQSFFDFLNRLSARIVPHHRWAFLVFEIRKSR